VQKKLTDGLMAENKFAGKVYVFVHLFLSFTLWVGIAHLTDFGLSNAEQEGREPGGGPGAKPPPSAHRARLGGQSGGDTPRRPTGGRRGENGL
jgi:hypothetical protein